MESRGENVVLGSCLSHLEFSDEASWQGDSPDEPILVLDTVIPQFCSILSSTKVRESDRVPQTILNCGEFAEFVGDNFNPAPLASEVLLMHRLSTFCFFQGLFQENLNSPMELLVV